MNRLLMAAARGARIEFPKPDRTGWQQFCMRIDLQNDDCRIHPDDAHLEYGPISSTFIAWASLAGSEHEDFVSAARAIAEDTEADWAMCYCDELHRSLFLLILAEAVCDEGL